MTINSCYGLKYTNLTPNSFGVNLQLDMEMSIVVPCNPAIGHAVVCRYSLSSTYIHLQ